MCKSAIWVLTFRVVELLIFTKRINRINLDVLNFYKQFLCSFSFEIFLRAKNNFLSLYFQPCTLIFNTFITV